MIRSTTTALALSLLVACSPEATPEVTTGDQGDREYGDAMEHQHEGETPTATAIAEQPPEAPITTATVTYATVDGTAIEGYLAQPEGATNRPAIVLIHEWWGLNDNIRAVADRFAGLGYSALAVDLYAGQVASDADQARALVDGVLQATDAASDNLQQAVSYLREQQQAPAVGVVGWCFGGGWSLQTGLDLGSGIDAVVMYYGRTVSEAAELAALEAPLLGLFGEADQGIPLEGVRAMESELQKLGKDATIVVYPGAGHAFANPSGQRYQAEAAEDAWRRTVAFFAEHLGAGGSAQPPAS